MKTMSRTRLLAIALVATFTAAVASPALANDEKKAIPVEMKYVGEMRNQPLFYMVFNGTEETVFTITVRDEYGNTLYRENVKGGNFTKKFLLNTEEIGDATLKFEVSSKSYEKPVVFEINKQARFVQDLVVSKK